jgi:TonB family protein
MRYMFLLAPLFLFTCIPAFGQQDTQASRSTGDEATAPALLAPSLTITLPKHCDALDGVVKLAATIDETGLAHALKTLDGSDPRLAGFATQLIEEQRFKPGTIHGAATAVAVELTVGLHTCAQRQKHPTDGEFYELTLRAHPMIALKAVASLAELKDVMAANAVSAASEDVGGSVSAPIPTTLIDPKIPVFGKLSKRGFCLIGITVDANGIPQNIHIAHSLDSELDSYGIEAVKNWRFKPALRNGKDPVAVEGTVSATFEYVDKEPVAFASFIPKTPEKVLVSISQHRIKRPDVKPLNADEVIALYMPPSRVTGHCLVSLVIDTNGVPQNVHVIKGLDSSLDLETVAMVEHLRFKPTMMDETTAIPVGLIVPIYYKKMMEKPTGHDMFTNGLAIALFSFL